MKKFGFFDPQIMALSPKVQRDVVKSLMKACMAVPDEKTKEEFKSQVSYHFVAVLRLNGFSLVYLS